MKELIIQVKHLQKTFNNRLILKDISFEVEKGSINGLLGPNGSGKTTMIRLLNGVITPTGGEISIMGFTPETDGETIRRNSGIVTESTNLYHEMTAWDNLMFFSKIYGVNDKERAEELLRAFDMWEHKDGAVGSFSTGMKKRVALAKSLLHRPKLLFLDEPTNGLDPEGIHMVLSYLKEINQKENITILICSHVLHQLENVCDNFLFIKNGELIENGKKQDLENRYIKEIKVEVETGLNCELSEYKGFPIAKIANHKYQFNLKNQDDISILLKELLNETWVHTCEITNRNLDTLYFLIGGEKSE